MSKDFKDLEVWKKSIELVKIIYEKTTKFPSEELYGLVSQLRKAAVSVPSNIAEGARRGGTKEFKYFLSIALGSLAEIETQIILSKELLYIKKTDEDFLLEKVDHIIRMIVNLQKAIK